METNKNAINNIEAIEDEFGLAISSTNDIYNTYYYFSEWDDEKEIKKIIKNVESMIRQSKEYKIWQAKIKETYPVLLNDNITSNITAEDANIEFHHYPFTLYDIVDIVLCDYLIKGKPITSFYIAEEVLDLHFKMKIGIVPLTTTNHELAHAGELFLSRNQIFGDIDSFIEKYNLVITNEMKHKLNLIKEYSDKNAPSDFRGYYK